MRSSRKTTTPAKRRHRFAFEALEPRVMLDAGPLRINEFLAINNNGLQDADGQRSDWIEIHNPTAGPVDLEGWCLTDQAANPTKWQFPSVMLNGGDHLTVFASSKDRTGDELHTNFKLDGDGEYLALVQPDGTTIAHQFAPEYPPQVADVSFGAGSMTQVGDVLLHDEAPVRVLVPDWQVPDTIGQTWTEVDFDDSSWIAGDSGVGYDQDPDYGPYILTDVEDQMVNFQTTVYVRQRFHVGDADAYTALKLRLRYEDGFAAYLNGELIESDNISDPQSNIANAPRGRDDNLAMVYREFDVSAYVGLLQPGDNVLAIHGVNKSSRSTDMLIQAELAGDRALDFGEVYFEDPSPGEVNSGGALGKVADTKFSVDRGIFADSEGLSFPVEITTKTDGAEIRYTTDGTPPTATTGTVYTGPILIDQTTNLRAAAYKPGYISSNVDTQTYLFLDDILQRTNAGLPGSWGSHGPDYAMDPAIVDDVMTDGNGQTFTVADALLAIPTISLALDMDDFLGTGGLSIYRNGQGVPAAVSTEMIYPDGSQGFQLNASVQIQGGSSVNRWKSDKLSMRLKFWEPFGPTKLDFPLFGDDQADRFDTLILDARLNQAWHYSGGSSPASQRRYAQYTRDQYVADIQQALGGTAPHGFPAHVYVNGIYWGIYGLHERPDESFTREYLGGEKDDYYVIKHRAQLNSVLNPEPTTDPAGANRALNDFRAMCSLSNLSTAAGYAQMQQYLDVPDFIDYMITNFYVGNTDWSHQNWYASRNFVDPDGRWRFHSWDPEHSLKGTTDNVTGKNQSNSPTGLHQRLTANAEYRMLFADRLHRHFFNDGHLTPEGAAALYQIRLDELDRAVAAESARWGDNQEAESGTTFTRGQHWIAERDRLLNTYFPTRTNTVLGQLSSRGLYPNVDAPVFEVNGSYGHGGELLDGDVLSVTADAGNTIYYTLDGSDPRLSGGAANPAAIAVSTGAAIPLGESTLVKSRARLGSTFSALNEAQYFRGVPATAENLAIAEINYNPHAPTAAELATQPDADDDFGNDDFEWVELLNTSDTETIDLAGVQFTTGLIFDFTGSNVDELGPGDRVVVVRDAAAFAARYGDLDNVAGVYENNLLNRGEEITLVSDWTGETIHRFAYNDAGSWPGRADGKGATLELADPAGSASADYANGMSWNSSSSYGGTPGEGPAAEVGVVVNEVLTHTDMPAVDAIELHNLTDRPIDVGGWYLSDAWGGPDDDTAGYHKFRIPVGTQIDVGGYTVFYEGHYEDQTLAFAENEFGGLDGFALDGADGDDVWLMEADPAGNLTRFADHVEFGAAARGESIGRWPNATGKLFPMEEVTLGDVNGDPRIGPVIISEVMYHPAEGDPAGDEFVELYNPTGQSVPLFDPAHAANTWRLDGTGFDFPQDATIPAGGVALVVSGDPAAFRTTYGVPGDVQVFGPFSGRLDNAGERLQLMKPDEPNVEPALVPYLLVDEINYEPDGVWPATADGQGDSLHRTAVDSGGNYRDSWQAAAPTPGEVALRQTMVVGREIFYNHSSFDGNDASASAADDAAIAPDKTALLPGDAASLANYTNYSLGINGIMVDVADLPPEVTPGIDDFAFRVGNNSDPASWALGPVPASVTVRRGAGANGSDRVTIVFADYAVQKQWLEVTVVAANLELLADDVFYFGNAVAEAGNSAANTQVTTTDLLLARNNPRNFLSPAEIDFLYDYNRDQRVNSTDLLLARNNQSNFLTALQLIDLGSVVGGAEGEAQPAAADVFAPAEIGWLSELDVTIEPSDSSHQDDRARRAVDQLLATFWE